MISLNFDVNWEAQRALSSKGSAQAVQVPLPSMRHIPLGAHPMEDPTVPIGPVLSQRCPSIVKECLTEEVQDVFLTSAKQGGKRKYIKECRREKMTININE